MHGGHSDCRGNRAEVNYKVKNTECQRPCAGKVGHLSRDIKNNIEYIGTIKQWKYPLSHQPIQLSIDEQNILVSGKNLHHFICMLQTIQLKTVSRSHWCTFTSLFSDRISGWIFCSEGGTLSPKEKGSKWLGAIHAFRTSPEPLRDGLSFGFLLCSDESARHNPNLERGRYPPLHSCSVGSFREATTA